MADPTINDWEKEDQSLDSVFLAKSKFRAGPRDNSPGARDP